MRSLRNACVIAAAFCPALRAADLRAKIVSDVVHYTDQDGQRRTIDVGRKCTDLWSAPDGSVIAFIGIDQFDPRTPQTGPEIDKSGVYVARRSDHFAPTRLPLKPITVRGIKWSIFRRPSVSPDGRTVYFEIPDSVVSSTLISFSFSSAAVEPLGGTTDYCVVGRKVLGAIALPASLHTGGRHSRSGIPMLLEGLGRERDSGCR